jgi:hypothetical protein
MLNILGVESAQWNSAVMPKKSKLPFFFLNAGRKDDIRWKEIPERMEQRSGPGAAAAQAASRCVLFLRLKTEPFTDSGLFLRSVCD